MKVDEISFPITLLWLLPSRNSHVLLVSREYSCERKKERKETGQFECPSIGIRGAVVTDGRANGESSLTADSPAH